MGTVECKCDWCQKSFTAKVADRNRGWAKCCSKACAASIREKQLNRGKVWEESDTSFEDMDTCHPFSEEAFISYF